MARTPAAASVLITLADVEPAVRLNALLEAASITTSLVSPLDDIRREIERARPQVIVLTGNLAEQANLQLVRDQLWDGVAVIGLADVSDPQLTDRLRAIGFVDVYAKPITPNELLDAVKRALERHELVELTGLAGDSNAMRQVLVKVEQLAPVSSTVLVEGESGTGKELVARAIHLLGARRNGPFIAVNIGALTETLLESELFGHEKGAFTGAAERRLGRFELANGGTLFLDEIGEIPLATQVKLLRILEEREVMRVGGTTPIKVDVRVVAATNQPLRQLVEDGHFRADLYYRLNVLNIYLPPLRERREDIPMLVRRFVREMSARHDRPFHGISAEAMQLLVSYAWPGNVRQLRNLIESMVVLAPGREITAADIPREVREGGRPSFLPVRVPAASRPTDDSMGAGRELEFIVRNLVDLRLQVEELRRRMDHAAPMPPLPASPSPEIAAPDPQAEMYKIPHGTFPQAIEPPSPPAPNVLTVVPGMTMAEIERAAIETVLRETQGNRRKAAELLGIGERTLYRKLREYQIPESLSETLD